MERCGRSGAGTVHGGGGGGGGARAPPRRCGGGGGLRLVEPRSGRGAGPVGAEAARAGGNRDLNLGLRPAAPPLRRPSVWDLARPVGAHREGRGTSGREAAANSGHPDGRPEVPAYGAASATSPRTPGRVELPAHEKPPLHVFSRRPVPPAVASASQSPGGASPNHRCPGPAPHGSFMEVSLPGRGHPPFFKSVALNTHECGNYQQAVQKSRCSGQPQTYWVSVGKGRNACCFLSHCRRL
nr:WAS/WASL-interacting protein family member 1-like [Saimiri boliviensis boliviensis]